VQLASFTDRANAQRLVERLRLQHLPATIAPLRLRGRMWWRVWVGPQSRAAAGRLAQRLRPIARGEVLHE
jgi:cell division septation protein DedD